MRQAGIVFPAGAGASGAVFGIAGALIVLLKSQSPAGAARGIEEAAQVRDLLRRASTWCSASPSAAATCVFGSGLHIDNMAHLGGFAAACCLQCRMVPRIGSPRTLFQRRLRIAIMMIVGVLVLFGFIWPQLAAAVDHVDARSPRPCKNSFRTRTVSFHPTEADHGTPRFSEACSDYGSRRCIGRQPNARRQDPSQSHCTAHSWQDRRTAFDHRLRRHRRDGREPAAAANIVAEAVDRGINYFDVAPSYGNAQERLGPALAPYRNNCFPGLQDRRPHERRLARATSSNRSSCSRPTMWTSTSFTR